MMAFLRLMRPAQWIKNLAVLAGPAFAMQFGEDAVWNTLLIFVAFCLISSASYAINDVMDREADALHPKKKTRPIACGDVSPGAAIVQAILLVVAGVGLSAKMLPLGCTVILVAYFVVILSYSLALKRRMILDVILIAVGFVLRATAGAEAVEVVVSPWLIVCTFTICLFMGFGKRRCEIAQFGSLEEASEHRLTLLRYTPEFLNHLISVSAGIAIMTFLLYTMDRNPEYAPPFRKDHLLYTMPLVVYGVFRFAMLVQSGNRQGPMDIIVRDKPFIGTIVIWGLLAVAIMTEKYWLAAVGFGAG